MSTPKTETTAAQTDVSEFITDLGGGQFDRMLSIALCKVAAAVVDHNKKGEVRIELKFEKIPGTSQVNIKHTAKYTQPTEHGKVIENADGATVLHVGKYGRLSAAQQPLIGKQGEIPT